MIVRKLLSSAKRKFAVLVDELGCYSLAKGTERLYFLLSRL